MAQEEPKHNLQPDEDDPALVSGLRMQSSEQRGPHAVGGGQQLDCRTVLKCPSKGCVTRRAEQCFERLKTSFGSHGPAALALFLQLLTGQHYL